MDCGGGLWTADCGGDCIGRHAAAGGLTIDARGLFSVDFASSSAAFHGSAIGAFSFCATSSSTSAVARVWKSGFITGPATLVTASIDPDSGCSTHDSRNE